MRLNRSTVLNVLLIGVIFIAAFLRFYKLGEAPPSPDWDEVALGYNAYSLYTTGKDEYGEFLPIVLRSFDDYKPALYAYLAIPTVYLFGLTTFAVRFPSALIGTFTVLATYFLAKELFKKNGEKNSIVEDFLPILIASLLAISPWHIQFSRIAFESNIGLGLNVFSILFFLKGLRKPIYLLASVICMSLSLYVYQSEKVFVPLLALVLFLIFVKQLLKVKKKYLVGALLLGVIMTAPIVTYTLSNEKALSRAKGVSIFTQETAFVKEYSERLISDRENNNVFGLLLNNRRVVFVKTMLSNYLSHYNLYWLFLSGDTARHHAPEMGLLYLWELPFLFIGIYMLVFGLWKRETKLLIFSWFLIAAVPASVTTGVPHAVRTLNFLPTFQIFVGVGILQTVVFLNRFNQSVKRRTLLYALIGGYFIFVFLNVVYFLNQYFVQQGYFYSEAWQYGYDEAIDTVKKIDGKYDKIVVSNVPHLDQSYMFFLFYYKYPPTLYHKEAKNVSGGFKENHSFGKFEFRPINWETEEKSSKILYFGRPGDFPKGYGVIKQVNFLNGTPAISIVEG